MRSRTLVLPWTILAVACGVFGGGGTDDTAGSGSDDGAGDAGSSGDGGSVDCEDPPAPDTIEGPDCVTRALGCGDEVRSTTEGGRSEWTGDEYLSWFCEVVGRESYQGPERVFEFVHPGTGWVDFDLWTPCENLDLFVVRWNDDTCPTAENSILECEGSIEKGGTDSVRVWNNEESRYLVAVEGPDGDEVPFGLDITCE